VEYYTFDPNDRTLIEAAIKDPNPDNPVSKAIAVRLDALRDVLEQTTSQQRELPAEITFANPATVLDEIVIAMFRDVLATMPDAPAVRILEYGRQ
jgi:hypothetical protein